MSSSSRSRKQLDTLKRLRDFKQAQASGALARAEASRDRAGASLVQAQSKLGALVELQRVNRGDGGAIDPDRYLLLLDAALQARDGVRARTEVHTRAKQVHQRHLSEFVHSRAQLRVAEHALGELRQRIERAREAEAQRDSHEQYSRSTPCMETT